MPFHSLRAILRLCKNNLKPGSFLAGKMLLCSIFMSCLAARGQKFPASAIPDSLKENANMVVRLDEQYYEIISTGKVISRERHVYTILNEKGEAYATYSSTYRTDKSVSINSISGTLYDASGREVRHFKKKDMEDRPLFDGSSFVNDLRRKVAGFSSGNYPYTVEFEEEDEFTELTHVGGWIPQSSMKFSVEKSVFQVTTYNDYAIRYKMINSGLKPTIEENGRKKIFTWEMRGMPAFDDAPYVDFANYTPRLLIGMGDVEMGNYKGNMSTWNDYAKFYGSLQKGRDVLPDETKSKVAELTRGISDPKEKVSVLYTYLQQNTHYVGVQLGIGGWQTYDAAYVATKKYGDCKALSNFMISLLKEAGIKANAVVIFGGTERRDFVPDFTYDPFNHVICCVPLGKDTVWLECTDQFLPAGYLGEFTSNRYGLFIDDSGGQLVHTPKYGIRDNLQIRKISGQLDKDGNLSMESRTSYQASCQDEIADEIHRNSKQDQLKHLKSELNLPTYDILLFDYQEDNSRLLPVIKEDLRINVNGYAQVSGKRMFVNPNILTRSAAKMQEDKDRKFDIRLSEEFEHIDSVELVIPAGYELESGTGDQEIHSKFGNYTKKTVLSGNRLVYYRRSERFSGRYPPKDYSEITSFYNSIYDADHTRIVLVKKS